MDLLLTLSSKLAETIKKYLEKIRTRLYPAYKINHTHTQTCVMYRLTGKSLTGNLRQDEHSRTKRQKDSGSGSQRHAQHLDRLPQHDVTALLLKSSPFVRPWPHSSLKKQTVMFIRSKISSECQAQNRAVVCSKKINHKTIYNLMICCGCLHRRM